MEIGAGVTGLHCAGCGRDVAGWDPLPIRSERKLPFVGGHRVVGQWLPALEVEAVGVSVGVPEGHPADVDEPRVQEFRAEIGEEFRRGLHRFGGAHSAPPIR